MEIEQRDNIHWFGTQYDTLNSLYNLDRNSSASSCAGSDIWLKGIPISGGLQQTCRVLLLVRPSFGRTKDTISPRITLCKISCFPWPLSLVFSLVIQGCM